MVYSLHFQLTIALPLRETLQREVVGGRALTDIYLRQLLTR